MSDSKNKKFLPIGSIVMLEGGQMPVMIIGYTVVARDGSNRIYDYNATFYPMGTIDNSVVTPFNHKQIKEVIFYGYEDDLSKEYRENLKKADAYYRLSNLVNPEYKGDE